MKTVKAWALKYYDGQYGYDLYRTRKEARDSFFHNTDFNKIVRVEIREIKKGKRK